jgi:transposase-like protein
VIYTTNAIESLNCQVRKVSRNRSILASDEAIYKIMYLPYQHITGQMQERKHGSGM